MADPGKEATAAWRRALAAGDRVGAYLAILAVPRKMTVRTTERASALGALYPHLGVSARSIARTHLLDLTRQHRDTDTGRVALTALAENLALIDAVDRRTVIDLACASRFGWQDFRSLHQHLTADDRAALHARAAEFPEIEPWRYLELDPPRRRITADLDDGQRVDCCRALLDQRDHVLVTFLEIYGVPDEMLSTLVTRVLANVDTTRRLLSFLDHALAEATTHRAGWVDEVFVHALATCGPLAFADKVPAWMAALFDERALERIVEGIVNEPISTPSPR